MNEVSLKEVYIKFFDDKIQIKGMWSYCVETTEQVIQINGNRYDFNGMDEEFYRAIEVLKRIKD